MPPRAAVPVPPLTQEHVKTMFDYNQEKGELLWRINKGKRGRPGEIAGYWEGARVAIQIDGRVYAVASIIWVWMTGHWPIAPDEMVDHINHVTADNSWKNLRLVDAEKNTWNTIRRIDNTSGYKGVHWNKVRRLYTSHIRIDGKLQYLGAFPTAEEASEAYKKAVVLHRGEEFSE